jgi:periplasmic copper chaperone A
MAPAMKKLVVTALLLAANPALAHSYAHQSIQIGHAWGLPSTSGQTQVFFPLLNGGNAADTVIAYRSPAAALIEPVAMVAGRPVVTPLVLVPGKPLGMRKGGFHLRLSGLKRPLNHGDKIPLTLVFSKAGAVTVEVWIEPSPYAKAPPR